MKEVFSLAALANHGDVVKTGQCSGASDWKLKLSPENGQIEVEFEVDQNRNRQLWHVQIEHNGQVVLDRDFRTRRPSGSFEAQVVEPNRAGADTFVARARNAKTGESGQAQATGPSKSKFTSRSEKARRRRRPRVVASSEAEDGCAVAIHSQSGAAPRASRSRRACSRRAGAR